MLEIQKWLTTKQGTWLMNSTGEWDMFASLEGVYSIKARRHPQYPNLVLFKYNQIESPMSERIVQEARGIILDENDNWRVVSRAFDKFFNYGEGNAATLDPMSTRVMEKLDGSLCVLYPYDGKWHVATSGTPDAGGMVNDYGFKFSELFWNNFKHKLPSANINMCFYFELTSKYNKVVVQHNEPVITLLGARELSLLQEELTPDRTSLYFPECPVVRSYPIQTIDDVLETFKTMSPLTQEGYVMVDAKFNRIKVKHPGYVALHHMADGLGSRKSLLKIVQSGEIDEVCTSFPEYEEFLREADERHMTLQSDLYYFYEKIADIESQKEFAQQAVLSKCSSALFAKRNNGTTITKYLSEMKVENFAAVLGYTL
jgi:hypothetical protein